MKKYFLFCFISFQLIAVTALLAGNKKKNVSPWFLYEKGATFEHLKKNADVLSSVSIFGNPPKEFIDECHKNKIEVYHAVGGNEKSIDSKEKITKLAKEYVDDCLLNGYDGVDLDFENLNPDLQNTYSAFLKEASKALRKAGKKMSHCVGFYPGLYKKGKIKIFYDPKVINQTCDLVRVMCYDMYFAPGRGDTTLLTRDDCQGIGPTSNYPWIKDAMNFWLKYVAADKLVMALPAYSNDYALVNNGRGRQVYASVPDSVDVVLNPPVWQWYEKINTYLYNDKQGTPHIFYASDSKSTAAMFEIADDLKINNIGFWHYSSADTKMWEEVKKWVKK